MAFPKFFCTLTLLSLFSTLSSTAKPLTNPKLNRFRPNLLSNHKLTSEPTQFFEVTKPVDLPKTKPCSHKLLTNQDFAFTDGKPPVTADYSPPSHCSSTHFSKIVLEWRATCRGTQFDRIFGVWLGGVELLRSCTAEPTASGIVWTVEKDITRYYSLLMKNESQTLAVFLGNVVDSVYTGVYHVNLTLHFYPGEEQSSVHQKPSLGTLGFGFGSLADLVLPISRNMPLNDGLWFEISDSVETQVKDFKIPRNTYRAVLEVYVSFHENDEFWYGNLPNEYIDENGITDVPGNGPFREVVVGIDGDIVGAIWPFPVIYTGGFNPLLWRPISGIGSFDLPSYDIEITPFLGKILDGKTHTFKFNVTNALNVWFVDANLHLWLDKQSVRTEGKLVKHISSPLSFSEDNDFEGLNGKSVATASRRLLSIGYVKSSFGNVLTHSIQDLSYSNLIMLANNGMEQIVYQSIRFNDTVHVKMPFLGVYMTKSENSFPLFLYTNTVEKPEADGYFSITNFTSGFNEDKSLRIAGVEFPKRSLKNVQSGFGYLVIENNRISGGSGSTKQAYDFEDGELSCYSRNVSSSNYDIVYDKTRNSCDEKEETFMDFVPRDHMGFSSS